jgi:cephalosporin hydroxylase
MVIDDCAHTFDNVLANLKNYGPMVTKGCYYIVEDTILGHCVDTDKEWPKSDTPMPAVMKYLKENDDFEMDRSREKFFITACPRGFLRKVK